MNENKHNHHQHRIPEPEGGHHGQRAHWNWKRAHRHWGFWVALFLMFAAMIVYVMTDDLSLRPRRQPQQSPSGAVGK